MPAEYIQTGVWELFDGPFHKRWVLTLEDSQGFWLLGLFAVLLILVQQRAWYILRFLVYHWKKPLRLDTAENETDKWLKMSQMEAVIAMFYEIRDFCFRVLRMIPCLVDIVPAPSLLYPISHHYHSQIPYRFGVAALINGTGFILIGIILPSLLTNWSTLFVKSKLMPYCDIRLGSISKLRHKEMYAYANAKYEQCWNRTTYKFIEDSGCSTSPPKIGVATSDCPFHPEVCMNETKPIVIETKDISYKDMGLNSRSKITISYRLTCSPVNLDPFIYTRKGQNIFSIYDLTPTEPDFNGDSFLQYSNLTTLNGPNKWSEQSSGRAILKSRIDPGLPVIVYPMTDRVIAEEIPKYSFHLFLRVPDGEVFFLTYHFGPKSYYTYPIDDPIFSAHIQDSSRLYHADVEITAIGCLEKYQYCLNSETGRSCTNWVS
ncbi:hypothetical protein TWF694_007690 [Orbilia ellipsospora]|uniref:Uncharacterized protein n=1 Tax=Orbilia ellipsospora TaxID=2528407 RepID=A0AAV9XIH3_9PEZI